MGLRGPLPDPKSQRGLQRSQLHALPARPTPPPVAMPADLTAEAAAYWEQYSQALGISGRINPLTARRFRRLCELNVEIDKLWQRLVLCGWHEGANRGEGMRVHHLFPPYIKLLGVLQDLEIDFGISLASDRRLGSPKEPSEGDEETDPFA